MKSSNLVTINERLNRLRFSLGLDWGELAKRLCISRSMLGFIRREEKTLSPKLMKRISDLEKEVGSNPVATCENCQILLNRVIELEKVVINSDRIMDQKAKAVVQLFKSLDKFKKDYSQCSSVKTLERDSKGDK